MCEGEFGEGSECVRQSYSGGCLCFLKLRWNGLYVRTELQKHMMVYRAHVLVLINRE